MTSYQNSAPGGKSMKFVDGLRNPFGGMLGQDNDNTLDDVTSNNHEQPLSEQLDTRLRIGKGGASSNGSSYNTVKNSTSNNVNNVTSQSPATTARQPPPPPQQQPVYSSTDHGLNDEENNDDKDEDDEWDSDFEDELLNTGLGSGGGGTDDDVLEAFRKRRLAEMKQLHEQTQTQKSLGHGEVRTITQDEFLPECTTSKSKFVVVHFYHTEFEKCKVMDMQLKKIASTHLQCKFVRIDAEKAPFFVVKLRIKTLPTIVVFQNGTEKTRMIGFEDLVSPAATSSSRNVDNFPTSRLGYWLEKTGAIEYEGPDDEDDDVGTNLKSSSSKGPHRSARRGIQSRYYDDDDDDN